MNNIEIKKKKEINGYTKDYYYINNNMKNKYIIEDNKTNNFIRDDKNNNLTGDDNNNIIEDEKILKIS